MKLDKLVNIVYQHAVDEENESIAGQIRDVARRLDWNVRKAIVTRYAPEPLYQALGDSVFEACNKLLVVRGGNVHNWAMCKWIVIVDGTEYRVDARDPFAAVATVKRAFHPDLSRAARNITVAPEMELIEGDVNTHMRADD